MKQLWILLIPLMVSSCASKEPKVASANEASLQQRISELQNTIRLQNSKIEDLNSKLVVLSSKGQEAEEIEMRMPEPNAPIVPVPAGNDFIGLANPVPPSDPMAHYEMAISFVRGRNYEKAQKLLSSFIKRYPQHVLADNACLHLGLIYMGQRQFERALFHFKQMVHMYPLGDQISEGQVQMALALRALKRDEEARTLLEKVVSLYKGSASAKSAERYLKESTAKGSG